MTKQELSQIYHLNREVRMWQDELDRLQEKSVVSARLTGMPNRSTISDSVGELASAIADISRVIEGKLTEIQIQRKQIIEYINGIEDSFVRQVIFYRCVSCMGWRDVAREIGGGCTDESARKSYNRYIERGNHV